jgi:hypothetical protein
MPRRAREEDRENRIMMEIIVDADGPEEQALGWYYYLEKHLQVPFHAHCISKRAPSPLEVGEQVEVIGLPPEEECEHEMFVQIRWGSRTFSVPLSQLEGSSVDQDTQQAIEDWHYWVEQGYSL